VCCLCRHLRESACRLWRGRGWRAAGQLRFARWAGLLALGATPRFCAQPTTRQPGPSGVPTTGAAMLLNGLCLFRWRRGRDSFASLPLSGACPCERQPAGGRCLLVGQAITRQPRLRPALDRQGIGSGAAQRRPSFQTRPPSRASASQVGRPHQPERKLRSAPAKPWQVPAEDVCRAISRSLVRPLPPPRAVSCFAPACSRCVRGIGGHRPPRKARIDRSTTRGTEGCPGPPNPIGAGDRQQASARSDCQHRGWRSTRKAQGPLQPPRSRPIGLAA